MTCAILLEYSQTHNYYNVILYLIFNFRQIPTSKSAIGHCGLEFVLNTLSTIPGKWYISVNIKKTSYIGCKMAHLYKKSTTQTHFWL